ncbi:Pycsar system effector family protein [Streptomyces sp. NPDC057438]|uniref:Pycsar system effector family protein n=1 Tax=Streptomyces sp. NPDC057438 TaxID=3346133 RepID=UPI0036A08510
MTTVGPEPVRATTTQGADQAAAMLRGELGRADSKASILLALTGAGLAGISSVAPDLDIHAAAMTAGVFGALALVSATVLLLLTVRPRLGGTGWTNWHQLADAELQGWLTRGHSVADVRALQAAVHLKFRQIQHAVDCMLTGVSFLVLAVVINAVLAALAD